MSRSIEYGNLMHRAMRRLISEVLEDVGENGLPGEHHFFITYDTTHPDVGMPDWLKERYPDRIMIVIQHWFEDLVVDEDGFSVTLNFGDVPVPLYVPFDALQTFVDPSVEFGLRFESLESEEDEDDHAPIHVVEEDEDLPTEAEIVAADSIRTRERGDEDGGGETERLAERARDRRDGTAKGDEDDAPQRDAEVVSLDSFRK
jgi:hypothetical protein